LIQAFKNIWLLFQLFEIKEETGYEELKVPVFGVKELRVPVSFLGW